ncbi:citrate synthase I, partial [Luminiphilus sp.]|nr:citrate synthase I [Luminiphilus sp.]
NEMIGGSYRIGRPRQLYTGYQSRDYLSVEER